MSEFCSPYFSDREEVMLEFVRESHFSIHGRSSTANVHTFQLIFNALLDSGLFVVCMILVRSHVFIREHVKSSPET